MERPADQFFTYSIKPAEDDIDALGHVNNTVYVRWIQQASAAHWGALTKENPQPGYIWVVLRHEIDYLYPAVLKDDIIAYTWVGEHYGSRSERFVQICNAITGKKIAESKTIWCLLSSKNMRPVKIDREMKDLLGDDVQ